MYRYWKKRMGNGWRTCISAQDEDMRSDGWIEIDEAEFGVLLLQTLQTPRKRGETKGTAD